MMLASHAVLWMKSCDLKHTFCSMYDAEGSQGVWERRRDPCLNEGKLDDNI